ncbi:N-acetylneuraminate synthase [Maridesulfovibrio ferrireducens]|uniref:N-acetylneuraminate synthase n=1 Tax=Maridesulfovibrio ferrireducens TaxID=246191 RepID=A0A1G9ERX7_9BACT|nr:N-acetylneuraminate synthase family protein [Maridesulfovibrio ferrireducens]SDK78844.1 N-acetylneuraminate synthase [Maridesulfovibrio ferrireducens]
MPSEIEINGRRVGGGHPVYIIAEMACAHHGSFEKAIQLLKVAVEAGVDAVQLQFFSREHLMSPAHPAYTLLGQLAFTSEEWGKIYDEARHSGLDVFVCTYDVPSVELALRLGVDGIKLNSSDLSNLELLKIVARSGLPFTIGTGASTIEEITESVTFVKKHGGSNAILMHGMQAFPTEISDAHINKINFFRSLFDLPVGYQDHTNADNPFSQVIDLLAIGAGACLVEKHYTLDRSLKETDYQAALNPDELATYVKTVKAAWEAMGSLSLQPLSKAEHNYRLFQKKKIVASHDLSAGHELVSADFSFLRTGSVNGFSPNQAQSIVGMLLTKEIKKLETLLPEVLED